MMAVDRPVGRAIHKRYAPSDGATQCMTLRSVGDELALSLKATSITEMMNDLALYFESRGDYASRVIHAHKKPERETTENSMQLAQLTRISDRRERARFAMSLAPAKARVHNRKNRDPEEENKRPQKQKIKAHAKPFRSNCANHFKSNGAKPF